jgi:hypothetical protein
MACKLSPCSALHGAAMHYNSKYFNAPPPPLVAHAAAGCCWSPDKNVLCCDNSAAALLGKGASPTTLHTPGQMR